MDEEGQRFHTNFRNVVESCIQLPSEITSSPILSSVSASSRGLLKRMIRIPISYNAMQSMEERSGGRGIGLERRETRGFSVWIRLPFLTKLGSFHNSTCTSMTSIRKNWVLSSNSPHQMGSFVWLTNTNIRTFREFLIVFIYLFMLCF